MGAHVVRPNMGDQAQPWPRAALPTSVFELHESWGRDAACQTSSGSVFFGPNGFESKRDRARREAAAKTICARCPVISACRDYAMRTGESFGVWGGLGEAERRSLMQRLQPRHQTAV